MAPYPEEIDVFTLPHSRMKELVDVYCEKLLYTDFKDYTALQSLLQSLHHTFCEFKSHEQIENKYIMRKLKKRLKLLSIHDATVCNCHSDNKLSDMLALVEDGYSCFSKPEADRINFGIKLQHALQEFTGSFLPHMKEEEEVFQPMLMKYFGYEELKCLKQQVIKEHSKWHTYDILSESKIHSSPESAILQLPREVMSHILSFLPPKDLLRCSQVCRKWYEVAKDPALWKEIYPCFWAHDIWGNYDESHEDRVERFYSHSDCCSGEDGGGDFSDDERSSSTRSGEDMCECERKEVRAMQGLLNNVLPHVGTRVQKLVVSSCRSLSNNLLKSFLKLCPNLTYLDISHTSVSDSAFKGLKEYSSCIHLQHLNMSGCRNISDLGLYRIADCMAMMPPDVPDGSHHLREVYLKDCQRFNSENNDCFCEIESCFKCISSEFCDSSCCWQKDGFMCHLAKLSLRCPYQERFQQPGASSIRKTTAMLLDNSSRVSRKPGAMSLRYLNISGCSEITDDGLHCLYNVGVLKKLEYLDVSGCWLMTGSGLSSVVHFLEYLNPENLYYCDQIVDGPHPDTSNGCQNLETGVRACCRQIV